MNAPAAGPCWVIAPRYDGTGLVSIARTGELSSVEAVPFPGERDPVIAHLPVKMLVGDCGQVGSRDVPGVSGQTVPGGLGDPAVVAMVGLDVMPMGGRIQLHEANRNAEWDICDEFETIDGMHVYCGGDLCDSDESDWEDLYDIAYAEEVEMYNLDVLDLSRPTRHELESRVTLEFTVSHSFHFRPLERPETGRRHGRRITRPRYDFVHRRRLLHLRYCQDDRHT